MLEIYANTGSWMVEFIGSLPITRVTLNGWSIYIAGRDGLFRLIFSKPLSSNH